MREVGIKMMMGMEGYEGWVVKEMGMEDGGEIEWLGK